MNAKKLLLLTVCFILAAAAAFAGGASQKGGSGGGESVLIKFWAAVQPEYGYDAIVENFNREFQAKGIQLEYVRYMNDTNGNIQLETYLASGSSDIDIVVNYGDIAQITKRAESELLLDLSDPLKQAGFDWNKEMGEVNVNAWMVNNRVYGLPAVFINPGFWWANATRFKEAGVPLPLKGWTWAEMQEALKKLSKGTGVQRQFGLSWGWNYTKLVGFLNDSLGKYTIYKDDSMTETNFDHPIYKAGLQLVVDTMHADKTALTAADIAERAGFPETFMNEAAFIAPEITFLRFVKDMENFPHDYEVALIPIPVPTRADMGNWNHVIGSGGGTDFVSIAAKSKHPKEALEVFMWYVRDGCFPLAKSGRLPLWSGADKKKVADAFIEGSAGLLNRESVENYLNAIDPLKAFAPLKGPAPFEIDTIMREEVVAALLQKKTVDQALRDCKSRADAAIKNASK
jgi:multiple sugar transport system substrate-binding protein